MDDNSSHPGSSVERLLANAKLSAEPKSDAQSRVLMQMRARMRAPALLNDARDALTPDESVLSRVWANVTNSLRPITTLSWWENLRDALQPADAVRDFVWARLSGRLQPVQSTSFARPLKWAAAFAVVLVGIRMTPLLFLAPPSIANSPITLFSPDEPVEVLIGSLWQQIKGELPIVSPVRLQGSATIVDHDDAVIRMMRARLGLQDLTDRPAVSPTHAATVALEDGKIWLLGLVPEHVAGVTVLTTQGQVTVHEGSVSIEQSNDSVVVQVLDRSALVERHGKRVKLLAGEQITLTKESELTAVKMPSTVFQTAWVSENLSRDAAHQHVIAALQQERRAAAAGILPGTTFYPIKRLAEQVDVLLTFDSTERAKKLITQANTRLNEAAALFQSGSGSQANSALAEYKETLLAVASGSGSNPEVQSLIQSEVVDAGTATVSAALPGDSAYVLKQAVDDTIQALPGMVDKPDAAAEKLLDQLTVAQRQVHLGETELAKQKLSEVRDAIASLSTVTNENDTSLRQEVRALAQEITIAVQGSTGAVATLSLGAPEKKLQLPEHPPRAILSRPLTPQQILAEAQDIRGEVFKFGSKKARYTVLQDELLLLVNNPSRGQILRALVPVLPRDGLAQRVLREIRALNDEVEKNATETDGTLE